MMKSADLTTRKPAHHVACVVCGDFVPIGRGELCHACRYDPTPTVHPLLEVLEALIAERIEKEKAEGDDQAQDDEDG